MEYFLGRGKFIILSALILSSRGYGFTSNPMMVGTAVKTGGPDAVCMILAGHVSTAGEFTSEFLCSGVLISPTQVLTAGHCATSFEIDPQLRMILGCGNKSSTQTSKNLQASFKEILYPKSIFLNSQYVEKNTGDPVGDAANDFSIVNLAKPSALQTISPLSPAQSVKAFQNIGPGGDFLVAGFGTDANGQATTLLSAEPPNQFQLDTANGVIATVVNLNLNTTNEYQQWTTFINQEKALQLKPSPNDSSNLQLAEYLYLNKEGLVEASILPGDSGGPLLFQENQNAPWQVVAVTSEYVLATTNLSATNSYSVEIANLWEMPDLTRPTKQVWPAP